ncbi:MAG: hypothetical protein JSS29_18430 [Proteobacteria bacterium]|nr:hypothetical protein [Pseudomonadota bacterium]
MRNSFLYLMVAACLVLGGCGGGGGTTDNTAPPPPPPALTPIVSLSANVVQVTADTSQGAPTAAILDVSVANPPTGQLFYQLTYSGTAIASASFAWSSSSSGALTVDFPVPAALGAGTYQGTVQLNICEDAACGKPVSGAPLSVQVSYTVTNNGSLGPVTFTVTPPFASYTDVTATTTPQQATFDVAVYNLPAAGLFLRLTQPTSGFVTQLSYVEEPLFGAQTGVDVEFTASLVSPASLGSGYFNSSVTFELCYDQACTQQVQGSPVVEPIDYTVYLTKGKEYTLQTAAGGGVTDLAYDGAGQRLYASALAGYLNSPFTAAITQINPATGALGTQLTFAEGLATLAVSDDGSLIYAGSAVDPVVHRATLPLSADIDIPLGSSGNPQAQPNIAAQLLVAPGAPHTLIAALRYPSGLGTGGTWVFDDATPRAQGLGSLGPNASPDSLSIGSTATTLYAYRYSYQLPFVEALDQVALGSGGLGVSSSIDLTPTSATDAVVGIAYAGGMIYEQSGYVRDAASGAIVGQLQLPPQMGTVLGLPNLVAVLPDLANQRVFVLATVEHLYLLTYDAATLAFRSIIDLGYDDFDPMLHTHMLTWGSNGVAFNRGGGVQILAGTFISIPAGTAQVKHGARPVLQTMRLSRPSRH